METKMQVKLLSKHAKPPQKASTGSAGFDLYSSIYTKVTSKSLSIIPTDLAIQIPTGCYGRIAMRSGIAIKHMVSISGGVIDKDYRGNIKIIMINHGNEDFVIQRGDRVAQLIIERISCPEIIIVDQLKETDRGDNGFGSTGKN